jgi:phospholipid transport system substrate-binding protein
MMSATYRRVKFALVVWMLLTFAADAEAVSAKEQLQGTLDHVIALLRTIHGPEDVDRVRHSLRPVLLTRFDFAAMARRSLGNRWTDLKGRETEFVSAFTDLVEHGYMSTLGRYGGEKVIYDRDRVEGESAEVDTKVLGGRGAPIKIRYKLRLTSVDWLVYDAVIDDVSVVENYRSQFTRILKTSSLDQLIEDMRAKASTR